jgi:hypothetical protein
MVSLRPGCGPLEISFVRRARVCPDVAEVMGNQGPGRILVAVKQLNYGCVIEIDTIAAVSHG